MSEHMALENLTVLDLTRVLAGPFCTMMLADMGANVIKIEVPKGGDDTRSYPPFRAKNLNGERESVYFANINRNKKGITLNLKAPEGKEIFKELVKKADIVVENYRPGVMDKLGLGYDVLKEINPRIIYLQHKIINSHAQAAFLMVSIVFAAGAFTGVVKNSGMLASMTDALVSIIPTSMGTFIAPIVGLFSVPLSLLFDPDSYYYGVMPVIANAVSAMGGNALAVAKASIMGQMTLGFPLSPLTGATFLLLGLSGQDLGDHQKHTLPYAWVASAIMVAVGCVACGLLF